MAYECISWTMSSVLDALLDLMHWWCFVLRLFLAFFISNIHVSQSPFWCLFCAIALLICISDSATYFAVLLICIVSFFWSLIDVHSLLIYLFVFFLGLLVIFTNHISNSLYGTLPISFCIAFCSWVYDSLEEATCLYFSSFLAFLCCDFWICYFGYSCFMWRPWSIVYSGWLILQYRPPRQKTNCYDKTVLIWTRYRNAFKMNKIWSMTKEEKMGNLM